jgi:hypothetical protein
MVRRHVKQPAEVVTLALDFAPVPLAAGETLAGGSVAVADASGADVTATLCPLGGFVVGTTVQGTFAGGAADSAYRVTFRATTSAGHVYEEELTLVVREL